MRNKYEAKNKASKPSYQSFFPNYKLSGDEKALLLFFEEVTSLTPDYGEHLMVTDAEGFKKFFDDNVRHFQSCADNIVEALNEKKAQLL